MALFRCGAGAEQFKPFTFIGGYTSFRYMTSGVSETQVGSSQNGPNFILNKKASAITVTINTPGATFAVIREASGAITGETLSASGSITNPDQVIAITSGQSVSLSVNATF